MDTTHVLVNSSEMSINAILRPFQTRLTLEKPIGHASIFASYDGEYEDVYFTVQVFSSAALSWVKDPPRHTYTQTVDSLTYP